MPVLSNLIQRFNLGEVSPLLQSRTDLAKYPAGLSMLENFIPLLQGPVRRRGGARFIARANNGGQPVALLRFAFSDTDTYIIEAGNGYLRFYNRGAPVLNGAAPYQISSPWGQADLFYDSGVCALKYVQSGDVMYIVCPGQPPVKLMRYGHTDWRIVALGGWDERPNPTAIALFRERLCLAYGQTICLSQSGAFENFEPPSQGIPGAVITSNYVSSGYPLVVDQAAGTVIGGTPNDYTQSVGFIPEEVVFTQISTARVTVEPRDPRAGISRIGYSVAYFVARINSVTGVLEATYNGYPYMYLNVNPNKATISLDPATGDLSSFIITPSAGLTAADDPIEINVYSEQTDRIEWLCPANSLLVGTSGGEFTVKENTTSEPLGPANIRVAPETPYGSSPIQALRVGAAVIFVQRSSRKLREFVFELAGDGFLAVDLTVASEHITRGGVIGLAWQSDPIETLWAARGDGELIGYTYSREQEMSAWHRHRLGGDGRVSQLAVIPAGHGGHDELWLSVRREIAGEVRYYLELVEPGLADGAALEEAFFVDSGLTFRNAEPVSEITGLDHLEGCMVAVLGDGGVQPERLVAGGAVSLQEPARLVQIGLPYASRLKTLNFEIILPDGTAQGRPKRIIDCRLRLIDSKGGAAGVNPDALDSLDYLEYRRGDDLMDQATGLFTGDRRISWPGGWETAGALSVVQPYALPLTLAAIIYNLDIGGKS